MTLVRRPRRDTTRKADWWFTVGVPAIGKPTMTQRDRWKVRDCVARYRLFCDQLRHAAGEIPPAEDTGLIIVSAKYVPPSYLSKKKRTSLFGTLKRTKPDGDNIQKAVFDALWKNDERLGIVTCERWWADYDETQVYVWLR